jgi:hypothetical protein
MANPDSAPISLSEQIEAVEAEAKMAAKHEGYSRHAAALRGASAMLRRMQEALKLCAEQAEEPGIWFVAERITEGYLQQELRRLHAAIEGRL